MGMDGKMLFFWMWTILVSIFCVFAVYTPCEFLIFRANGWLNLLASVKISILTRLLTHHIHLRFQFCLPFSPVISCHIRSYPARMILFLTFIVSDWVTELTLSCLVISPTPKLLICWELPELAMEVCGGKISYKWWMGLAVEGSRKSSTTLW